MAGVGLVALIQDQLTELRSTCEGMMGKICGQVFKSYHRRCQPCVLQKLSQIGDNVFHDKN